MNYYFLMLYILTKMYKKSDMKTFISIVKFLNGLMAAISPENKSSAKLLRGNVFQVKYFDPKGNTRFILLPISVPARKWKKVKAVVWLEDEQEHVSINVTKLISKICGPGKDFFKAPLTPKMINSKWISLKFSYPRKRKPMVFKQNEVIKGL